MPPEHARHLLHWLDAGEHGLVAPGGEEFACPSGRLIFPKLLEVFFEQVGADGLQVVAEQIAQAVLLLGGEILFALQNTPTGFLQQRGVALLDQFACFAGADFADNESPLPGSRCRSNGPWVSRWDARTTWSNGQKSHAASLWYYFRRPPSRSLQRTLPSREPTRCSAAGKSRTFSLP